MPTAIRSHLNQSATVLLSVSFIKALGYTHTITRRSFLKIPALDIMQIIDFFFNCV